MRQWTCLGNAMGFVERFGDSIRFSTGSGWVGWNGKHWEDSEDSVAYMSIQWAEELWEKLLEIDSKESLRWAKYIQSAGGLSSILRIARSLPQVRCDTSDFNPDQELITFGNGTLNLRTNELLPHSRAHMITASMAIDYDDKAECPRWLDFLAQIMNGSEDMIKSLQQMVGYSLSGFNSERCIFILHGDGANGKSTFLDTLITIFGSYGSVVSPNSLMVQDRSAIPDDIAALKDKRFVTSSESDSTSRLSEAFVKSLTGDLQIPARFLYKGWFRFEPRFKLWLATNHKPRIIGTDNAIWDRIRLIPFAVRIPRADQDRTLRDKLVAEGRGIVNWAVQGYLEWNANERQIDLAPAIHDATNDYRTQQDTIGQFIDDNIEYNYGSITSKTEIYRIYVKWCEAEGHRPLNAINFGEKLRERKFEEGRTAKTRGWKNIRLAYNRSYEEQPSCY